MAKSTMAAAALAGLVTGAAITTTGCHNQMAGMRSHNSLLKHSCAGLNACKGQGGCKTTAHACKGLNACKGQGGCKVS